MICTTKKNQRKKVKIKKSSKKRMKMIRKVRKGQNKFINFRKKSNRKLKSLLASEMSSLNLTSKLVAIVMDLNFHKSSTPHTLG